jgi:hypothetical protein
MAQSITSFTLNSVDYSGTNYNMHVMPMIPIPEFRLNIAELGQSSGVVTQGTLLGALTFDLQCHVIGSDSSTRDTRWANVLAALQAAHVAGLTTFSPTWTTDTFLARPVGGPEVGDIALNAVSFRLKLIVPSGAKIS